jgi:uncharacterized protein YgbK (DUF1537 family)
MPLLLGCIADDFTGATDLAGMLVKHGMRTVQVIGVPQGAPPEADAIVVALKIRTAPVASAVGQASAAFDWLAAAGAEKFFWKYCSTFDSTDLGNIGPVADMLTARTGAAIVPFCPAFPANGRSVFQGHLFVGTCLLNESGMENHPLTPMRDPDLVRVLGRQTTHGVGLAPYAAVSQGPAAIRAAFTRLADQGRRYAICDAIAEQHLIDLGAACDLLPLVTGGSGMAMGLPALFRAQDKLAPDVAADALPRVAGPGAVVSGSCSRQTLFQIGTAQARMAHFALDPLAYSSAAQAADAALAWASDKMMPVLIAASAPPETVAKIQERMGREVAGQFIESALAEIAAGLVSRGVRRLVVAGGETSGAVVQRLGVSHLRIGPEIDPGVPWTHAPADGDRPEMLLALKSGNFGGRDFFANALAMTE